MKLITSSSPHIRSGETTRRLMGTVLLALLPTLAAGVWFFGLRALLLTLVSVASMTWAKGVPMRTIRFLGSFTPSPVTVTMRLVTGLPSYTAR